MLGQRAVQNAPTWSAGQWKWFIQATPGEEGKQLIACLLSARSRHIYQHNLYMWEDKMVHAEAGFNKAAAHRHT